MNHFSGRVGYPFVTLPRPSRQLDQDRHENHRCTYLPNRLFKVGQLGSRKLKPSSDFIHEGSLRLDQSPV
jgi:hypothetical protein